MKFWSFNRILRALVVCLSLGCMLAAQPGFFVNAQAQSRGAPALPQKRLGIRLAIIGDSTGKLSNFAQQNTFLSNESRGDIPWARMFNSNFLMHVVYDSAKFDGAPPTGTYNSRGFSGLNNAVSGNDTGGPGGTPGVLTILNDVIAVHPDVVLYRCGTNDITVDLASAATIQANILTAVTTLTGKGIKVIVDTITPRPSTLWAVGSAARLKHHQVNSWIRNTLSRYPGVTVIDSARAYTDPATGEPIAGVLDPDGLHPNSYGGYIRGKMLSAALTSLFPNVAVNYYASADDTYDATNNVYGNIIAAVTSATAGTAGTGVTGSVMTGYRLQRNSGSTATAAATVPAASASDPPAGGYYQQAVITCGGAGGNEIIQLSPTTSPAATFTAGEYVQAGYYVKVTSNTIVQAVDLQLRNNVNTGYSHYGMKNYDLTQKMPTGVDYAGWIVTEPFLVPASPSTWLYAINLRVDCTINSAATIQMGGFFIRKIDDPTLTMWNYVLERDLNPASNDNSPAFSNQAA